jgi:hypothetical protein
MLRIPHCLDIRLTDGGKVVSPTHPPHFTPQKHYYFYVSGTHFCWRLNKPQGLVRPEGLGTFKKKNHLIGYRTRDLPVCSVEGGIDVRYPPTLIILHVDLVYHFIYGTSITTDTINYHCTELIVFSLELSFVFLPPLGCS